MSPHIYERSEEIDITNSGDSLALIARQVGEGSEVLELGVATGYFSRFLTERLGCKVDGVEIDPIMAEEARPQCRSLVVADLNEARLADHFPRASYDLLICADVLEHLADPRDILRQAEEMLRPGGMVIMSIPNVAYIGLVLGLLEGEFEYRGEGILDRTHRHFFSRRKLLELLKSSGYEAVQVEPVHLPLEQSEFFERLDHMSLPLTRYLLSRPDADVYQYVVAAKPAEDMEGTRNKL
ncbi:MAG: class I SAM-dependent methyltransferase [Thermoleophilia bacterium]